MREYKKRVIYGILFLFSLCIIYLIFPIGVSHSTVTSGQVVRKSVNKSLRDPYVIDFRILSNKNANGTEDIMIKVNDYKTWSSIKEKEFYFVNYQWKNSEMPSLEQIKQNPSFGKIYKNKFN